MIRTSRFAAVAVAVAVIAGTVAATAIATRGSTRSAATTQTSSTQNTLAPRCPNRAHSTGGGFSLRPGIQPPSSSSITQRTIGVGRRVWSTTSASTSTTATQTFRGFVRCERRADGRIATKLTGSTTVTPPMTGAQAATLRFICPPGTHVLSGGYAVDKPFSSSDGTSSRLVFVQNRRTGARQWKITAWLAAGTSPSKMIGRVFCEFNQRNRPIARKRTVPYVDGQRNGAAATCPRGTHVVSGGFRFAPLPAPGVAVIGATLDRFAPLGPRRWRVDAWDLPFSSPPNSTLTTFAYCHRNRRTGARAAGSAKAIGPGSVELIRTKAPRG